MKRGAAAAIWMAILSSYASAVLVHRYTFNDGTASDSQGTAHGMVVDPMGIARSVGGQIDVSANNGEVSGQDFSLPTTRGAYIDLPNGIVSAAFNSGQPRAATFETWATVATNRTWSELFSFGLSNLGEDISNEGTQTDYITLIPQSGATPPTFRITTHAANVAEEGFADTTPLSTGMQHHIVVTADHNDTSEGANGTLKLYLNNQLADTGPIANLLDLGAMIDDNNWLGRSQWNDPLFDGSFNEFRIYDHALTAAEVATNFTQGPVPAPLPSLTVNRDTGQVSITNQTPSSLQLAGYSIISAASGLDQSAWDPIAPTDGWTVQTQTSGTVAEQGGTPLTITGNGGSVNLGSAWIQSPFEDLQFSFTLPGGVMGAGTVTYQGNNGAAFRRSDLDTDGDIDAADYTILQQNNYTNLTGLTGVAAYLRGDLDRDGDNDHLDFRLFKNDFNAANGAGAFNALVAGLPEPATGMLVLVALFSAGILSRRGRALHARSRELVLAVCALSMATTHTEAALKHKYTFNNMSAADSIGTAHGTVIDPTGITTYTQGGQLNLAGNNGEISNQTPFAAGAFVDLPNGTVTGAFQTGTLRAATFETWVTVETHRNWAEIYAFGTSNGGEDSSISGSDTDYITLIPANGAGSGTLWTVGHPAGGGDAPADAGVVLPTGVQQHIVSVFDHNNMAAGPNGTITQYLNGQPAGTTPIHPNLQLDAMVDNNNWLGRSQWPDPLFDGYLDEFRIYDHALTAQDVSSNFTAGPDIPDRVALEVNTNTGAVRLKNVGPIGVNFDFYRIESPGGALNQAGWNSLSDQNIDSAGAAAGESWDESGGANQFGLSEIFLESSSTLASGASYNLGSAFNPAVFGPGTNGDLKFFIVDPLGETLRGRIEYVTTSPAVLGDYNNNGTVDAADYVLWRNNGPLQNEGVTPGSVTPEDYQFWRSRFGATSGSGSGAAIGGAVGDAVPEPASAAFFVGSIVVLLARRTRRLMH
jgi:hypothetical protein